MSLDRDLKLPNELRDALKQKLGEVVSGPLPERYLDHHPMIAVGDYVLDVLHEQGVIPDVGIFDGKTRRGPFKGDRPDVGIQVEVHNPPEYITVEAWEAIEDAVLSHEPVLINVHGEEDLLALASIALAPIGGIVIYGIPLEGMVVNIIDDKIKEKTWQVINSMEKVNQGG